MWGSSKEELLIQKVKMMQTSNTLQSNQNLFAGLLRPLETVSKTSHKFDVNVFNNRKIH